MAWPKGALLKATYDRLEARSGGTPPIGCGRTHVGSTPARGVPLNQSKSQKMARTGQPAPEPTAE